MSSAATTRSAGPATHAPAVAPAPARPTDPDAVIDDLDRSYLRAILVGSIIGVTAFIVVMWIVVKALAPEWSAGAVAVIAVWCGIWSGLFLGGTVAVGRWSMRNGH